MVVLRDPVAVRREAPDGRRRGRRHSMKNTSSLAQRELQTLADELKSLDDRLRTLTRRAYLTPREQEEAALLKRKKLHAKDRMHRLSRAVDTAGEGRPRSGG